MITPKSDAALERYPDFVREVRARLELGKLNYGDESFDRPPAELASELQQECMDLAGWGFILYSRLEEIKQRLTRLEESPS